MAKSTFHDNWFVSSLDKATQKIPVSLPHDAMLAEPRTADSAGGTNIGWFEGHDYIYTKAFPTDPAWEGKTVLLELEGVYHNAEVWLNGKQLAFHPYGYTGFYVDLTDTLRSDGENTLEVIARNADQPSSRWYSGAGIYRPVWLHVLPKEHIEPEGVKITTTDHINPRVKVRVKTSAPGEALVELLDGDAVIGSERIKCPNEEANIPVKGARLWCPEDPYLYTCRVTFGADVQEVKFGVRTISCDPMNGFRLNGKRVILRGACLHHDNGLLGAITHPFAEERKVRLLKENGYNAIRSSHNPCSKALLDACDKLGMLMVDEYVDMWYIHKTQYDYAKYMPDRWRDDLKDISDRDYNHPCVVMYSIGNEVSETAQERGIKLTESMTNYLHSIDYRPVTCGVNIFFNFLSSMGFGVYSDKKAAADAKKAEKSKGKPAKKKAVGSEFFNNLAGLLGADFMKFGATLHGSDVKTRDAFAKLDVAGYNYGVNRYERDLKKYPDRVILGSETFCSDAARFWDIAKDHPSLIGDFVWTGMDYIGEVGIGSWDYEDYAPNFDHGVGWLTGAAGRLDITGKPTGEAAYTMVAFELSPIRIGVVPADHAFDKHAPSSWRMSNTYETWAWNGCEGKETRVEVYARGARAALFLNGEKLGEKAIPANCRTPFKVTWQPGTLEAVSYDEAGKELARTSLKSAREGTKLTLLPEQAEVGPDELCYVRLAYTDDEGMVKPLCRANIKVTVEGGTLLGLGSACPYNERGYLTDETDTYYGEALAIIQPDGLGEVTLTAESKYGSTAAKILCAAK